MRYNISLLYQAVRALSCINVEWRSHNNDIIHHASLKCFFADKKPNTKSVCIHSVKGSVTNIT